MAGDVGLSAGSHPMSSGWVTPPRCTFQVVTWRGPDITSSSAWGSQGQMSLSTLGVAQQRTPPLWRYHTQSDTCVTLGSPAGVEALQPISYPGLLQDQHLSFLPCRPN